MNLSASIRQTLLLGFYSIHSITHFWSVKVLVCDLVPVRFRFLLLFLPLFLLLCRSRRFLFSVITLLDIRLYNDAPINDDDLLLIFLSFLSEVTKGIRARKATCKYATQPIDHCGNRTLDSCATNATIVRGVNAFKSRDRLANFGCCLNSCRTLELTRK
jgi:hypothetical protein